MKLKAKKYMLKPIWKLLALIISREEILTFKWKHFIIGLFGTWIVGIGRYWDDEGATMLQHWELHSAQQGISAIAADEQMLSK